MRLMPDFRQLHQQPPPPPPPPAPAPAPPPASTTPVAPAAANAQPNPIAVVKPRMIIKSVLGRYERWNPVHPTAGAFWGVGLGLGCGVGWGPGFGPEVIGYVGGGCGVGFSVGFTLAGVGIGLPQHGLIRVFRNQEDSGFASNVTLDSARFYAETIIRGMVWDAISYVGNAAAFRKESGQKLLRKGVSTSIPPVSGGLDPPNLMSKGVSTSIPPVSGGLDLPNLGKGVSTSIPPVSGGLDLPNLGKGVSTSIPPVSGGLDLPNLRKGLSTSIRSTVECIKAFKDQHWPT